MSENQYDNFKEGIKSDVKEAGAGLLLVGGLILLAGLLFAFLVAAVKDNSLSNVTRTLIIIGVSLVSLLLIFSKKIRMWILGGWIILLIGIPVLFVFFLVGYMFYTCFK